jgi:putative holliday junction resolvase
MRFMGIDYGVKRIGVALSDEAGEFAFPKATFPRTSAAIGEIVSLAESQGVSSIVLGESKDFGGRENDVMKKISVFRGELEKRGFEVRLEEEYFSTVEAERFQGKTTHTDASAAAIILQRFLDKRRGALY